MNQFIIIHACHGAVTANLVKDDPRHPRLPFGPHDYGHLANPQTGEEVALGKVIAIIDVTGQPIPLIVMDDKEVEVII